MSQGQDSSRPRYCISPSRYCIHDWLLDAGAREGDPTLMEVGLLAGLLGAFANPDATRVVGGRFEEAEDGELTLVAPGSDFRL